MMAMALIVTLMCCMRMAAADPIAGSGGDTILLAPPQEVRPIVVRAFFHLRDINEINSAAETFDFSGVLTLKWHDPRQAFDPAVEGVKERVFQGGYQFNELAAGWYPQVILVNESGMYQKSGVVLRVQPDGTSTLIETLSATAKTKFNMRLYPFDSQRLEAVFDVLGFDRDEVLLKLDREPDSSFATKVPVPQWDITEVGLSVKDHTPYSGFQGVSSALFGFVDVQRKSYYMIRLIVLPLIVIVLLSFSVFWMDRSSVGDRTSVSFIGILTAVAYQNLISDQMPHIAYITWMHSFLNLSFLTMCATVVINLVVSAADKRRAIELGDRIDRRCRWGFPLAYFGILLLTLGVVPLLPLP